MPAWPPPSPGGVAASFAASTRRPGAPGPLIEQADQRARSPHRSHPRACPDHRRTRTDPAPIRAALTEAARPCPKQHRGGPRPALASSDRTRAPPTAPLPIPAQSLTIRPRNGLPARGLPHGHPAPLTVAFAPSTGHKIARHDRERPRARCHPAGHLDHPPAQEPLAPRGAARRRTVTARQARRGRPAHRLSEIGEIHAPRCLKPARGQPAGASPSRASRSRGRGAGNGRRPADAEQGCAASARTSAWCFQQFNLWPTSPILQNVDGGAAAPFPRNRHRAEVEGPRRPTSLTRSARRKKADAWARAAVGRPA